MIVPVTDPRFRAGMVSLAKFGEVKERQTMRSMEWGLIYMIPFLLVRGCGRRGRKP